MKTVQQLEEQKNSAYAERNQLVALVARMAQALGWKAWRALERSDIEPDWRNLAFVELPTGQVSWHFHDSETHLLGGLPQGENNWDGHLTSEKYRRVNQALRYPYSQGFGWALAQMKQGRKVSRQAWNRCWVALTRGSRIPPEQVREGGAAKHLVKEGNPVPTQLISINAHFDKKLIDGSLEIGWTPTQNDLLAEDWYLVE